VYSNERLQPASPENVGSQPFERFAYESLPEAWHAPSEKTRPVTSSYEAGWFGGGSHEGPYATRVVHAGTPAHAPW
jgi:hypothetical protein